MVYRLATKGTVEEDLLLSADAKRRLEKLVIKKGGFKTMGQKLDSNEIVDKEILQSLLLRDGEVYQHSGGDRILSDEDVDVLCDRYILPRGLIRLAWLLEFANMFAGVTRHLSELREALAMLQVSRLSKPRQMVSPR